MATLVILVAIFASEVLKSALRIDSHLVNVADTDALTRETGSSPYSCLTTVGLGKAILTERPLLRLPFLRGRLEHYHHTTAGNEVFIICHPQDEGSSLRPCAAVGGPRIPGQGEVMTTGKYQVAVVNERLLILLVEEHAMQRALAVMTGDEW